MTTPTPAGWYPDPDGSGGQRYWDGNSWTDHRAPAADPPADEGSTAVVQLRSVPSETRVGAHRKPDPDPDPDDEPAPSKPDPAPFDIPPPAAAFEAPAAPSNGTRRLLIRYSAACGALLLVLIGVAIYGFLIKTTPEIQLSAPPNDEVVTEVLESPLPTGGWGRPTAAAPAAAPGPTGDATDGPLSFTVRGMDIVPTVAMADAPLEKTAAGQFVVVRMNVTNSSPDPATFIAMFQTLHAGGSTYQIDDEATAYLEGTYADLAPGASQDVGIAFDVPAGTAPEFIELHVDPTTAGAQLPLP